MSADGQKRSQCSIRYKLSRRDLPFPRTGCNLNCSVNYTKKAGGLQSLSQVLTRYALIVGVKIAIALTAFKKGEQTAQCCDIA